VSLPLPAHNYLVLHTLAKGTTKSKILTRLINNWIKRQKEKEPEIQLLQEIIQRVNEEWKVRKDHFISIIDYKSGLANELESKGLNGIQIHSIIKAIKEK
jgi:hypothetical protein